MIENSFLVQVNLLNILIENQKLKDENKKLKELINSFFIITFFLLFLQL